MQRPSRFNGKEENERNALRKVSVLCALILALCLTLSGCASGPKQTAADSAEEATVRNLHSPAIHRL